MKRSRVVVVGAGFGGLSAAVELARCGAEVVVVEREQAAGGKARSVEVAGRRVDVGPTVLTMRSVFDAMFEASGRRLDDAITLHDTDVVARHAFADGSSVDLFKEIDRSAAAIARLAGDAEAAAYRRFAARGARIAAVVEGPFMRSERPSVGSLLSTAGKIGLGALASIDAHRTMWSSVSSTFTDPRLRALFARYATYVGSSPFEAPATLDVIAHVEREGVAIPEGGMSALAAAVAELARSLGVVFRWNTRVREVLVEGGRASGVVVEREDGSREVIEARAVLVNADVATLASGALGERARSAVPPIPRARRSLSAVTWAIVGRAKGFPLAHHNVFFSRDYRAEHAALFGRPPRLADEATVYVCAQDRAGGRVPEAGADERFFVIVNAPAVADTAPLSNAEVQRCETGMFQLLSRAGLEIEPRAMVVTTPTSYEAMAPGTGGAIYGEVSHGPLSALSRQSSRTKIPGLFLAGGSVHPGAGVPMATLGGRSAASAVLSELASTYRSPRAVTLGFTSTR